MRHSSLGLSIFFLLFSGCGPKGFQTLTDIPSLSSSDLASNWQDEVSNIGPGVGVGYTLAMSAKGATHLPQEDFACLTSGVGNACVFRNSPVFQRNAPLDFGITKTTDLTGFQTWAVTVSDLDSSGYLENQFISVSLDGTTTGRAQAVNGSWKFPYNSAANADKQLQVHIYVFLTGLRQLMTEKAGFFFNFPQPVEVRVYNSNLRDNAYYLFTDEVISIGYSQRASGNYPMAIDADIALHEYGHGVLHHASLERDLLNFNSVTCPSGTGSCCETTNGCMGAIHEGQADFHTAIMSPSDPRLGTTWLNQMMGLRNPAADKHLTTQNVGGRQIHNLGRMYSSIWYEIYKSQKFHDDVVTLFMEHLKVLTGADTFVTAKEKILILDQSIFSGKYSSVISAKFGERGL